MNWGWLGNGPRIQIGWEGKRREVDGHGMFRRGG